MRSILGSELKILLKRKGIMQSDIVRQFNVDQPLMSRYMTDKTKMPYDLFITIAYKFGLQITDLVVDDFKKYPDIEESVMTLQEPTAAELMEKYGRKNQIEKLAAEVAAINEQLQNLMKNEN